MGEGVADAGVFGEIRIMPGDRLGVDLLQGGFRRSRAGFAPQGFIGEARPKEGVVHAAFDLQPSIGTLLEIGGHGGELVLVVLPEEGLLDVGDLLFFPRVFREIDGDDKKLLLPGGGDIRLLRVGKRRVRHAGKIAGDAM